MCSGDGNPFNTTIAPTPSSVDPELSPAPVVSTGNNPNKPSSGPPVEKNKKKSRKFILIISVVASIIVFILLVVVVLSYFSSRERKHNSDQEKTSTWEDRVANEEPRMDLLINSQLAVENNGIHDGMRKIKGKSIDLVIVSFEFFIFYYQLLIL